MGKIIFILGGARSGKSAYALQLAKKGKSRAAFIATCQELDKEMSERIKFHKKSRPANWQTFEEPYKVSDLVNKVGVKFGVILIDCLTLLVSNLMLKGAKKRSINREAYNILSALNKIKAKAIIVSNEVGLGIVPNNKLGRNFRDIAGKINQIVAKESDEAYFMVSGIPWKIK